MSGKTLVEWTCGAFAVRLFESGTSESTYITVACNGTRLQQNEYDTVREARNEFGVICALLKDVVTCIQQDPTVVGLPAKRVKLSDRTCKMCGKPCKASDAHLHQGSFIGDECCWDERLRSTE